MTERYAMRSPVLRKHIMFAIPCKDSLSDATLNSLLKASSEATRRGWGTDLMQRTSDSCIQRARCFLFTHFLERTQCTDMLFVDDDIGFSLEGFARLMEFPVDIVGGAYRARAQQEHYILRGLNDELRREPPHGLMEVEGCGTGFLRITRAAAEEMAAAYPDDWYEDPTCQGLRVRNLFEFEVRNHKLYSEDYNFCRKWRALGPDHKVWIDPEQVLDHVGHATFRGQLLGFLNANVPKIPEDVPIGDAAKYVKELERPKSLVDQVKAILPDEAAA